MKTKEKNERPSNKGRKSERKRGGGLKLRRVGILKTNEKRKKGEKCI